VGSQELEMMTPYPAIPKQRPVLRVAGVVAIIPHAQTAETAVVLHSAQFVDLM
jgi:hypothetical protein